MTRQAWPTVLTGDSWSAAQHNTYGRDNEAAHWTYTTAGDMQYATASNALARLAIGTARKVLRVNSGATAPSWGGAIASIVSRAAVQSINNNSSTAITFDTETKDTDSFFALGAANKFTIPYDGYYLVTGWISFANNATGYRTANLQDSGSNLLGEIKANAVNGDVTSLPICAQIFMLTSDTVKLFVYQNSGGALNVTAQLSISFIGA